MNASATAPSGINVGCLVVNVSLGKLGKQYQKLQELLIRNSGVEWTCKRAKAIWNVALLLRANDQDGAISVCRENSISHSPHTGIPKGIEGTVVKKFVEAQRPAVIKQVSAALRWYTSLKLAKASKAQVKKALKSIDSVSSSAVPPETVRHMGWRHMKLALEGLGTSGGPLNPGSRQHALQLETRVMDRVKHLISGVKYAETLKSTSKYYSRVRVPKDLRAVPYSSMCMSFMTEPWLPPELDERTPCAEMRQIIREQPGWSDSDQAYAGKITLLQEQGCKARVVAQPTAWLQLAFVPLHDVLMKVSSEVFPLNSCVTDQTSGAYAMMNHQANGFTCACTDLSSATDRFPLHYSLGVLDALGLSDWADALEKVVAKPFKCDFAPNGEVYYRTGQPMGLYGSFPLFHLSNMCLANGVYLDALRREKDKLSLLDKRKKYTYPELDRYNTFSDGSRFKTVGDDIVFSDLSLSHLYRQRMEELGVQCSESKCFEGPVAEFAGFISTKTNQGTCCFRPYKVPAERYVTNPIQFLESLGAKLKSCTLGKGYWARQWKSFSYTRPWRDLALEAIIPTSDDRTLRLRSNRGDADTLVNMAQAIATVSTDPLPDLSGSTRVNKIPLFRERGMFDFYGYNPDELIMAEREVRNEFSRTAVKLSKDPLMEMQRDGSLERLSKSKSKLKDDDPPAPEPRDLDTVESRRTSNHDTHTRRLPPSFESVYQKAMEGSTDEDYDKPF